ncbi:hypothetical protein [Streptomyces malaysiensis]|uniref:FHA domain-containing protein n=1 Tax=Streptomyces autolyticus TaxID=75293 RepID=A0ABN4VXJ3_9ACTN|nr:hypothetical protein [Streptomyces autolyticus]AQA09569.1 hypothetical protein BV401_02780 [Streptomyces autolyticus]
MTSTRDPESRNAAQAQAPRDAAETAAGSLSVSELDVRSEEPARGGDDAAFTGDTARTAAAHDKIAPYLAPVGENTERLMVNGVSADPQIVAGDIVRASPGPPVRLTADHPIPPLHFPLHFEKSICHD